MKHAKHPKPLRVAQIALALLAALAAGSAAGQAGPSYGPVLDAQPTKAEPGARPEQTPQAQEEKAGAAPPNRQQEVDPSARPAPQATDPAQRAAGKPPTNKAAKKQAARQPRRSVQQRIATVPEVAPSRPLPFAAPPPAQPVPSAGPAQINSCLGGTCTDTAGGTYHTGVGNAAVNGAGRLCTRSGNTMQCF